MGLERLTGNIQTCLKEYELLLFSHKVARRIWGDLGAWVRQGSFCGMIEKEKTWRGYESSRYTEGRSRPLSRKEASF